MTPEQQRRAIKDAEDARMAEIMMAETLDMRRRQALALWLEWFADVGDPSIPSEMDGDPLCFFCGCRLYRPEDHEPDCIYVRAKALVAT